MLKTISASKHVCEPSSAWPYPSSTNIYSSSSSPSAQYKPRKHPDTFMAVVKPKGATRPHGRFCLGLKLRSQPMKASFDAPKISREPKHWTLIASSLQHPDATSVVPLMPTTPSEGPFLTLYIFRFQILHWQPTEMTSSLFEVLKIGAKQISIVP